MTNEELIQKVLTLDPKAPVIVDGLNGTFTPLTQMRVIPHPIMDGRIETPPDGFAIYLGERDL